MSEGAGLKIEELRAQRAQSRAIMTNLEKGKSSSKESEGGRWQSFTLTCFSFLLFLQKSTNSLKNQPKYLSFRPILVYLAFFLWAGKRVNVSIIKWVFERRHDPRKVDKSEDSPEEVEKLSTHDLSIRALVGHHRSVHVPFSQVAICAAC